MLTDVLARRLNPGAVYGYARDAWQATPAQALAVASALPAYASALLALGAWVGTRADTSLAWARAASLGLFVACLAVHFTAGFVGNTSHLLRHREGSPPFDAPFAYPWLALRFLVRGR